MVKVSRKTKVQAVAAGKKGGKRHRHLPVGKRVREGIDSIPAAAWRRIMRRAGAVRVSPATFEVARTMAQTLLGNLAHHALVHVQHARRRTIAPGDVRRGLASYGHVLYGV